LRGAGIDYAILDEAAFMQPTVWTQIIRPMLLDTSGGALFISTPFGRNWFYDLYKLGIDPEESDWTSFHFTSYDNPYVPADDLVDIERNTPEHIFKQEYLAEFTEDAGSVFRGVKEAMVEGSYSPNQKHRYVMGVDWGRSNDFTVAIVIDADTSQMVDMVRFNQIGWAHQRGRIVNLYHKWNCDSIWAEENSIGSVNIEALQSEGIVVRPFMTTVKTKGPLISALSLAIERGDLGLMNDGVLKHELTSYQIERLPSGTYKYEAPPGGHDDTVIALALAWHGVSRPRLGAITFA
jgi:hypothetical protein